MFAGLEKKYWLADNVLWVLTGLCCALLGAGKVGRRGHGLVSNKATVRMSIANCAKISQVPPSQNINMFAVISIWLCLLARNTNQLTKQKWRGDMT